MDGKKNILKEVFFLLLFQKSPSFAVYKNMPKWKITGFHGWVGGKRQQIPFTWYLLSIIIIRTYANLLNCLLLS